MEQGHVRFHEKGEGRALIELAKQYPPKDAIREFVTNSLDARIQNITEDILVIVNPYARRVIVSDNGIGMKYNELITLPTSVGYSKKAGNVDMRGEKALGLLAFGSLGNTMHIISKHHEEKNSSYGYIRWQINESKEGITFCHEQIDASDVEKSFYGNFPHGTRIIIDNTNPHIMDKILTIPYLKNWLRILYNPALRKGIVNISLGRLDKRSRDTRSESLEPINYERTSSSELIDGEVSAQIKSEVYGNLEMLLFVDPEAIYDKVAVYSKDVLVYESIAELPEFSKSAVWTSGKVSGYINDHFNKLILGRVGIDRNRNAFKAWYNTLSELEERIKPVVDEKKKHGIRVKESNHIKVVYDTLTDVFKEFKRIIDIDNTYTRDSSGELILVEGAEPTKKRRTRKKEVEITEIFTERAGPGTFIDDPKGVPERVVPKRGILLGYPQPVEFEAKEAYLRSKLEELLGSPKIFLNSAHEDYKSRVDAKDSDIFRRYLVELIAKEVAFYEVKKAQKENKLVGEKSEIVDVTLQREEMFKFLALKRLGIK